MKSIILVLIVLLSVPVFGQMWIATNGRDSFSISAREVVGRDLYQESIRAGIRSQVIKTGSGKNLKMNLANQFITGLRLWQFRDNSRIALDLMAGLGLGFGEDDLEVVSSVLTTFQYRSFFIEAGALDYSSGRKRYFKIGFGLDLKVFI